MSHTTLVSSSGTKNKNIGLAISALLTLLIVGSVYISQLIFQEISESFHVDLLSARFVFSLSCISYAISFFIFGPLSDKVKTKTLLKIGCVGTIGCLIGASLISSYNIYLVLMSLLGFFSAAVPSALYSYAARNSSIDELPQTMGLMISASILGIIFSRSVVAIMTDHWSWQTAFIVYAIMVLCGCLLIPFGIKNDSVLESAKGKNIVDTYKSSFSLIFDKTIFVLLALGFLLFFVYLGITSFLTFYLKGEPFNISSSVLGLLNFAGISSVVGATISSKLSKIAKKKIILYIFLTGVGVSIVAIGFSHSLGVIGIGIFSLFLFVFGIQPIVIAALNQLVAGHSRGAISSLYLLSCLAGGSAGTYLLGLLWAHAGWNGVIMACLIIAIIKIFLVFTIRNTIKEFV